MHTIKNILLFLLLAALPAMAQRGMRSPAFLSSIAEVAPSGSAPDAPTDLAALLGGNWEVCWTDNSMGDMSVGIELGKSTDGGVEVVIGGLATSPDACITSSTGSPGDTHSYAYRVRATNAFGQSAWTPLVYTVWAFNTAYYKLEEAASNARAAFVDTIGLGTLDETGGTVAQAAGKNNNASAFTSIAASYFTSANAIGTGVFDASFSISFWIFVTALPIGVNNQILVRQAQPDLDLQLTTAGNLVWLPDPTVGDGAIQALGSLNAWHFVVVTASWSTGDCNISVDGASFTVDTAALDALPAGDDFLYVCSPFGMLLTLNGRIDELACYNAALSIADVGVLYGGGTAPIFR